MAAVPGSALSAGDTISRQAGVKLKLGLNAFSFNGPLLAGTMTLADAVDFCAMNGVDALDATGYYFPGYPNVPPDEYIYTLKRKAFVNGVAISGTGVRNNFAVADEAARKREVQTVKDWIVVASKLGAPVIRVFAGPERPAGTPSTKCWTGLCPISSSVQRLARNTALSSACSSTTTFLKLPRRASASFKRWIRSGSPRFSTLAVFALVIPTPRSRSWSPTPFPGRSRRRWVATESQSLPTSPGSRPS